MFASFVPCTGVARHFCCSTAYKQPPFLHKQHYCDVWYRKITQILRPSAHTTTRRPQCYDEWHHMLSALYLRIFNQARGATLPVLQANESTFSHFSQKTLYTPMLEAWMRRWRRFMHFLFTSECTLKPTLQKIVTTPGRKEQRGLYTRSTVITAIMCIHRKLREMWKFTRQMHRWAVKKSNLNIARQRFCTLANWEQFFNVSVAAIIRESLGRCIAS